MGEADPAHANVSFPCSSHLSAAARQLSLEGPFRLSFSEKLDS